MFKKSFLPLIMLFCLIVSSVKAQTETLIPDSNFEQALIDQGHDDVIDGKVLTANVNSLTSFFIDNKSISDLTGIEAFTSVTYLSCQGNNFTTFDISALSGLEQLWISNSGLASLDLTGLTSLEQLRCKGNNITSFNTIGAPNLLGLYIQDNGLTSLNVQNSPLLTILEVYDNQLTSLDVSANTMLTDIYLRANQLTTIDLSTNVNLTFLGGSDNLFTSLDFSNNPIFDLLQASGNNLTSLNLKNGNNTNLSISITNNPNLTCVAVDDVAYSNANWTTKDAQTSYATDCTPGIKIYAKKDNVTNAPRIHVWPNETESVTANWPNNLQFMSASTTYSDYFEYEVKNGQTTVNSLFIFDGVQSPDQTNITQDTWFSISSNGTVTSTTTAPVIPTIPVLTVSSGGTFTEGTTQTLTASATLNAEIRYAASPGPGGNPTDPTATSTLYTGAISVSSDMTYKFIAFNGSHASDIITVTYTFEESQSGIKIYAKKDNVTNAPRIHVWPNEVESDTSNWPNNLQFMGTSATYPDYFEYEVKNNQTTVNTLFIFDGVQSPDQMSITQDTWFSVTSNNSVTSTTTAPTPSTTPELTVTPSASFAADTTESITASATLGASIYYTTSLDWQDPVDPTEASTLYTGPIDVSITTKFKFIAYNGVHASSVESTEYTFPVIPVLTVSPDATYEEGTVQTITATSTLGAPIHYTVSFGGTPPVPTTSSPIFSGSELVSETATYNFRAFNGANASFMETTTFTFAPPTTGIKIYAKKDGVSNAPRIHVWPNEVESDTSNWPNNLQFMTASASYSDYFEYEVKNGQTTVNTLFLFDGVQSADQMSITQDIWFTIASDGTVTSTTVAPGNPLAPSASSSADGTFVDGTTQTIVATATLGASIWYTSSTTGTPVDPDFNDTLYTGPITVTDDVTYKFVAYSSGFASNIATTTYTFESAPTAIKIYAKKEGTSNAPRIHVWPNEVESVTTNWPNNLQFMTASATYSDYFEYEVKNGQTSVNTLFIFDGVQSPDQNTITQDTWFTISSNGTVTSTTTPPSASRPGLEVEQVVENSIAGLIVAPSPANTYVQVSYPYSGFESGTIEIYNLSGQRVAFKAFSSQSELNERIDVSALANGIHLLSIQVGINQEIIKFSIVR